ncbi:MAG: hypothetical protein HYT93_04190 [Parcubacteria group bacterium]|nr:hypothetical protein [Parcubacteria group bacterium]
MGKRITFALFLSAVLATAFFLPVYSFAQVPGTGGTGLFGVEGTRGTSQGVGQLENPIKFKTLGQLVTAIIDIIIQIAVPIAALFLIYSGYLFVSARGSDDDLKKAKSIFLWTLVGIAVLLGAKVLASIIQGTIDQIKR